jgi:DNA-binding CsgD family transcriptional regulator
MYQLPSDLGLLGEHSEEKNLAPILPCLLKALQGHAHGIALLEEDSSLLYSNTAAQCILTEMGWGQEGSKVLSSDRIERDNWLKALRNAVKKQTRSLVELTLLDGSIFVALMPISVGGEIRVVANFGLRASSNKLTLQLYASHHHLTSAEIDVLEKLAKGIKPLQIAVQHQVALSTINTHLANIRVKTGCASVNEILVKLSHLPTLRPTAMQGVSVNMFG